MIKRLFTFVSLLIVAVTYGQDLTTSPYSYYGIGLPGFYGTADSRAMGGLSIYTDNVHFNLQNPASLGALRLTNLAIGANHQANTLKENDLKESSSSTSFDYLAVAIPTGKLNFGFGITPHSTVGYKLFSQTDESISRFEGNGGLSKVLLAFGYEFSKNFRVGIEGNYNFGKVRNENLLFLDQVQYGTREKNRSDLGGFSYKFGVQYDGKIRDNLLLSLSANYAPGAELTSENQRQIATISLTSGGSETLINQREIELEDTEFKLPSDLRMGVGIGWPQKWFLGAEYQQTGKATYSNTSFAIDKIDYKSSNAYRLGGFYVIDPHDLNYLKRIAFRAGLRYQEAGFSINQEDINEFGISFGLGLPAGNYLSNVNLGVEYGERGTTASGLVKENFVNIFVGISLNDQWFKKRKFN